MLVDFTVENYRSIKGPVTLSAVAQGRKAGTAPKGKGRPRIKPDYEIAPGYPVEGWGFKLLPVLAIFGANASGKSNVVNALDSFLNYIRKGEERGSSPFELSTFNNFVPFKLDSESLAAPTRFEIRIARGELIHTYSISLNRERILSEHLEYALAHSKRNRRLFHRDWDENKRTFIWKNGEDFKGPHTQLEKTLSDREPFMSILPKVHPAFENIMEYLPNPVSTVFVNRDSAIIVEMFSEYEYFEQEMMKKIVNTIRQFDTGITEISLEKNEGKTRIFAHHDSDKGIIRWPFGEESLGTQRLFALSLSIHFGLSLGLLTTIDELGSNIHPNITREIIKIFQNPKTNPKHAQLIFTSHDSTLQRGNLLRRDQIWFTQKRPDGSTELYPLSDFKVRNDLAIDKAYLDGRFGAVPFLADEEFASIAEG